MAANKLQWKRIAKGDRLPCDSLLMKKDGTIPSVVSGAGVKVGQDAYYLPVDEVIEEIRNYPIEESEDERIRKELLDMCKTLGKSEWIAWLEQQGEQKHQYNSRPRYVGEEELLGTNKQGKCPFSKQELIDMGFAFTQDGDLAYPIHKIEKKEFAAWSEEDEENSKNILYILNQLKGNAIYSEDKIAENCIDWLKALKDRVQPQPKQEWSEEDIRKIKLICTYLDAYKSYQTPVGTKYIDGCISWAKTLKERVGCKANCPTMWKPSDEQMDAVRDALDYLGSGTEIVRKHLMSLYDQLKRLREDKL